jgi:hypothetical protein
MARQKRRRGALLSIAQLLDRAYPGQKTDRVLIRTFSWWDRTVPERISRAARPVKLRDGTLLIHTRSAGWAQELSFFEEDLLRSVQAQVPDVKRLRIRVGPMPPPPKPQDAPPQKTVPIPVTELPPRIARELARIGDDGLREAVTRAACTSLAPPTEAKKGGSRRRG